LTVALSIGREIEIRAKKKRYFMTGNSSTVDMIKVAVVTGQHPFDVPSFHAVGY
jgi:hypothetical protein